MEAELSPAFSYRQGSVRLVLKDMLACGMAIVLLPDLALRISADKLLSASIRVSFYISGQHLAVPRVTSGGSRRRECLKPAKKPALRRPERCAAPVQPRLSPSELPPPRRERRYAFPGSKYPAPAPCRSGCRGEAPCSLQRSEIPLRTTGGKRAGGRVRRSGEWKSCRPSGAAFQKARRRRPGRVRDSRQNRICTALR